MTATIQTLLMIATIQTLLMTTTIQTPLMTNDNLNSTNNNSNSTSNTKRYITLLDLTMEQELTQFSNNNKGIMFEHAHNTDAKFEHEYSEQTTIVKNPSHI
ncbi:hypothetical protein G9A89_016585 [Geosiphon pyriformis]|nr:hypothetical protein G9A89_016585 [Geosiphon pyriformis]